MPQVQPMRAVLFITMFAVILSAVAGMVAVEAKRWAEALAWLLMALAPAVQRSTIHVLFKLWNSAYRQVALAVSILVLLTLAALWMRGLRRETAFALIAVALAFHLLLPALSKIVNYSRPQAELDELAKWARENTSKDAVFLFPDAGRSLDPGVFRAEALRSLYVDWKGGGQINYLPEFVHVWLPRWRGTMEAPFIGSDLGRYKQYGIDFVALNRNTVVQGHPAPVFQNAKYAVYRVP